MTIEVQEKALVLHVALKTKGTAYSDVVPFVLLLVWEESPKEISV